MAPLHQPRVAVGSLVHSIIVDPEQGTLASAHNVVVTAKLSGRTSFRMGPISNLLGYVVDIVVRSTSGWRARGAGWAQGLGRSSSWAIVVDVQTSQFSTLLTHLLPKELSQSRAQKSFICK